MINNYKKFFKWKSGTSSAWLKDYLEGLHKHGSAYSAWFIENSLWEYILKDILKLFTKSLLNCLAANRLIKSGYFTWAYTTAYYSSFFSVQWINRFYGIAFHFIHWTNCKIVYDKNNDYFEVKSATLPKGGIHKAEFKEFYDMISANLIDLNNTFPSFSKTVFINNNPSGMDSTLRNEWNYSLDDKYFFELGVDNDTITIESSVFKNSHNNQILPFFKKLINSLKKIPISNSSPFTDVIDCYELSIERLAFLYELLLLLQKSNPLFDIAFKKYLNNLENKINKWSFSSDKDININFF
ncbi:MAG: hypothetical protein ACD_71C00187G0005 [uncultured bacterium (gcode 4)]|uniref:Uncharacterized protein n=1 Tax=uncultured bacterium (gcode 4) TaxID=1234023 RepID=K1ZIM4_9BACT|nr:MAG: hypothetical protein ACD_71C00187G0005 [uncultured bacterium (gcode 4)]